MLWVLLQNSPWPFLFNMTILSTISQNILVRFLLKVLPRVENTQSEGTELHLNWHWLSCVFCWDETFCNFCNIHYCSVSLIQMMFCSVPLKCVFSTLGNTLSKKRTKMFCEMVNKMVMLNKNGQGLFWRSIQSKL